MSDVINLTEEQATQIKKILGVDPVALIAIDPDGTTQDYSLGPQGSPDEEPIYLHDFKYVDLGCLHIRVEAAARRCCYYRCDSNGCRCLWYC